MIEQIRKRLICSVPKKTINRKEFKIYNEQGFRYCLWLARDQEQLKKIFSSMDVTWESILPVVEAVPDLWGQEWQEHLEAEKTAATLGI
jgi:hypothetical protein